MSGYEGGGLGWFNGQYYGTDPANWPWYAQQAMQYSSDYQIPLAPTPAPAAAPAPVVDPYSLGNLKALYGYDTAPELTAAQKERYGVYKVNSGEGEKYVIANKADLASNNALGIVSNPDYQNLSHSYMTGDDPIGNWERLQSLSPYTYLTQQMLLGSRSRNGFLRFMDKAVPVAASAIIGAGFGGAVGPALGGAVGSATGSAAAGTAAGAVAGGATAGALQSGMATDFQDSDAIKKGAATGAVSGGAGAAGSAIGGTTGAAVGGALGGAGGAAIQGGNSNEIIRAGMMGGAQGAISSGINQYGRQYGVSPWMSRTATGALTGALRGGSEGAERGALTGMLSGIGGQYGGKVGSQIGSMLASQYYANQRPMMQQRPQTGMMRPSAGNSALSRHTPQQLQQLYALYQAQRRA